ncbi:MAG TPA: hypothetical protein PK253_02295 [Spirochaetota bacterium]|nr:hypothetical protein [Spirochaetota bacterium]HPQ52049.1 hypothetical protein [Spirochaetota bacterium]
MNRVSPELEERLSQNLHRCAAITGTLFKLKTALYKQQYPLLSDREIREKITAHIIARKEAR